jgi:hypothetical protein
LAGEPLRPVELCTRDPDRVAETAKSGFGSNEIILHFSVVASRSGDKSRRDLPTPATPETSTRRAERRSAEAWKSSFTSRIWWSRPVNGASRTLERCEPAVAATTRVTW